MDLFKNVEECQELLVIFFKNQGSFVDLFKNVDESQGLFVVFSKM